jgi:pyruvate formate lyase activating enzyme
MDDECLSRRRFVKLAALGAGASLCPAAVRAALGAEGEPGNVPVLSDHEAIAYEKLGDLKVRCKLCPRECTVADKERGYCGVRENQGGVYKTLVYARPCSIHKDPIEKKPLFHVLPKSFAFSIATAGCNVECLFCQNWEISQFRPEEVESSYVPPDKIAQMARDSGCATIAYTYSEPVIFYEYMLDCAREGNKLGVRSVMISNGYINAGPMEALCKELTAVKIDLKAFTEQFYEKYVHGELKPVLATIELLKKLGMHTEIVVLLIPGLNDGADEVKRLAAWVVEKLGPDVPLHFTRFYPAYKMTNLSPTPLKSLERARDIAVAEGVHYAYSGNVPGHEYEQTYCHKCGKKLISRYAYHVSDVNVVDGKCGFCGAAIPGVWK